MFPFDFGTPRSAEESRSSAGISFGFDVLLLVAIEARIGRA